MYIVKELNPSNGLIYIIDKKYIIIIIHLKIALFP